MAEKKGNKVELATFLIWKKPEIGYEVENDQGKTYVVKIWCKVCTRHGREVRNNSIFQGKIQNSLEAFIKGKNSVTKFQVDRLLRGPFHEKSLEIEGGLPDEVSVFITDEAQIFVIYNINLNLCIYYLRLGTFDSCYGKT